MRRGRPWYSTDTPLVLSPEWQALPEVLRATHQTLVARAADRVNGGRFIGARRWSKRDAMLIAGGSLGTLEKLVSHGLASWDGEDLIVAHYDVELENSWKKAVEGGGKRGGNSRKSRGTVDRSPANPPPRHPAISAGGPPPTDPDSDPDREVGGARLPPHSQPDRSPEPELMADVDRFLAAWREALTSRGRLPPPVSAQERLRLIEIRRSSPDLWGGVFEGLTSFAASDVNPTNVAYSYARRGHCVADYLRDLEIHRGNVRVRPRPTGEIYYEEIK